MKTEQEYLKDWSNRIIGLLKFHKVAGFEKRVQLKDITSKNSTTGMAVVEGTLVVEDLTVFVTFYHQEGGNGKYQTSVWLTSPIKAGAHEKKCTGKNSSPEGSLKILDNMFSLKYVK